MNDNQEQDLSEDCPKNPRRWISPAFRAECLFLAMTFLIGAAPAAYHLYAGVDRIGPAYGAEPEWFAPAIMFACGKKMLPPAAPMPSAIKAFLDQQTDSLDAETLPKEIAYWSLSPFQQTHLYLLYTVGWTWRIFGVSWDSLKILLVAAYALTMLVVYGIFRLAGGRMFSMIGAAVSAFSPVMLALLPSVRDFSKAPFLLALIWALGCLLKSPLSFRRLLLYAAAMGAGLGCGLGFREDMMVGVPPILLVLLCGARGMPRFTLAQRGAAILLMAIALGLCGAPILNALQREQGAVSSHSLTQGLADQTEQSFHFGGASYSVLFSPADPWVHAVINSFARRTGDRSPMENYLSPAYGRAGGRFFKTVAATFPADILARAWAVVLAEFRVPRDAPEQLRLIYTKSLEDPFLKTLIDAQRPCADHLARWGCLYALAAWLLIAIKNGHAGLWLALLTLYFFGYPSILFQYRHTFYLTPMIYWFFGVAMLGAALLIRQTALQWYTSPWRAWPGIVRGCRPHVGRAALCLCLLIAIVAVPLAAARRVQQANVQRLLTEYRSAARVPIPCNIVPEPSKLLLQPNAELPAFKMAENLPPMDTPADYLVAEFKAGPESFIAQLAYDAVHPGLASAQEILIETANAAPGSVISLFFPVYAASTADLPPEVITPDYTQSFRWLRSRFLGIRIPEKHKDAFLGLSRVTNTDRFPLFLTIQFAGQDDPFRFYKSCPVEGRMRQFLIRCRGMFHTDLSKRLAAQQALFWQYPDDPNPYAEFDRLLGRYSDPDARTAAWRDQVSAHPQSPWTFYYWGAALYAQSAYADAANAFGESVRLHPNLPGMRIRLLQALNAARFLEPACQELRECRRLGIDVPPQLAAEIERRCTLPAPTP